MMPSCSHTGTPSGLDTFRHFTSSTTLGAASLMSARRRDSISPRHPPRALILASISFDGDSPAAAVDVFLVLLAVGICCGFRLWAAGYNNLLDRRHRPMTG